MADDVLLNINNFGIVHILMSLTMPNLTFDKDDTDKNVVNMTASICRFLTLCCTLDNNYAGMIARQENFNNDLVQCIAMDYRSKRVLT